MGLKDLRLKKGFTLHGLAEASGVNYQKIWQIENNKIKPENIALKTALRLSAALECRPCDLVKEDSDENS